ncbi:MAG: NUDIX hydrolase [Lentisphaerae bacterium]|nr:NUDIX hydrolase [Lentisphaerota bacterium]MCP4100578.1 NUDIX hydrolase [Lentisphaerota bacterium]
MDSGWHRISKETVFKTSIFNLLREDSRNLRTGAEQSFFYFECIDWINVVAITTENEIILIEQYRHGSDRIELEIPGGGLDPADPDPVFGGARELMEETGYQGEDGRIIGQVCPNPAIQGNTCYTVLFENCKKISEPQMEETESINTVLLPLDQLDHLIDSGKIRHGLVLNALSFYERSLREAE